jgi:GT2 family glycosyltransferase
MRYHGGVTVIIPTYNRQQLLDKTLLSLCFQSFDSDRFEVIVVDDGSSDNTEQVVASYHNKLSISYYFQEDKGFRVAKARNIGIRNARFSVCLFLDSGVLANPRLIENHWRAHHNRRALALIGYTYGFNEFEPTIMEEVLTFDSEAGLEKLFAYLRNIQSLQDCRAVDMKLLNLSFEEITIPWLLFWTCHASCSTESLVAAGAFDEHFQSWGGEDVELALRLHKMDVPFEIFPRGAEVIHCPHERSAHDNKRSSHENCKYIYKKHPSRATYLLSLGNYGWQEVVQSLEKYPLEETYG